MTEPGLRERKRLRTHQAISDAAIHLFLQHGFDQVSVAQIADAAEVSKRTLFKYFPSKEDLVVHRFADHVDEHAATVASRKPGQSPLAALRAWFLNGLAEREPTTGLIDDPGTLTFYRLVLDTPSVASRLRDYTQHGVEALARELRAADPAADPVIAELAATQVIAVQQALAEANWRILLDGMPADQRYPDAVTAAEHGFDLLANGLATHYG